WVVWNLFTRERRRRVAEGFRRAAIVISLAFVAVGAAMLYRAVVSAGSGAGQAVLMIVVGLGLVAYQRWGR
ncbi:MAG: hypothetical protein ACE5LU_27085, partial [Anaerolineae bacterium]